MTAAINRAHQAHTNVLSRMWGAILLRAIAAVAFAFLAFLVMGKSLPSLIVLFSAYALVDGLCSLIGAMRGGGVAARIGIALTGVASIGAAALAQLPDLTWDGLATIVGGWAAIRGGFELLSAITLRRYMERDWSLALIAGLSIVFGLGMILGPALDPWTFVRLLSVYALIVGLLLAVLALRFARGFRA